MVNGHHRSAEAKRYSIPSMRVVYQSAIDAADARRQGAISNISAGAGTVWDAARFIKESPDLQDLVSLKAAGKTSKGGLWREGLALSRLPDDLFKAAQDGVIDAKYAVMIGNSGLDPEKMAKLFGVAAKGPSVDEFTARMLIARQAPAGEVSQANLFGDTSEDLSDELAKLYAAVRKDLTDDKNTFGRLGRKSEKIRSRTESTIDVKGSISVSEEAKSALRYYEDSWLTDPEITQLMNGGALELRQGVPAQAVAGKIKQQLPEILQRRLAGDMGGAEEVPVVPGADNPDQGGLFGSEPAAPEPDPVEAQWAAARPDVQDKRALQARAALLSEKQIANRRPKAEALKAREAEATAATTMSPEEFAAQYPAAQAFFDAEAQLKAVLMADPKNVSRTKKGTPSGLNRAGQKAFDERVKALGEYPGPTTPKNAELKPIKELEAHDAAVRYLEWYDNYVTQRELTPADRDARKASVIARAAQNGEIRPDETPIPDVLTDDNVDINAAAAEADQLLQEGGLDALSDEDLAARAPNLLKAADEELRLRALQAEQDAEVARAMLEAEREAEGYQSKTFAERRKEVAAGWDQPQPASPLQTAAAPAALPEPVLPWEIDTRGKSNFYHGSASKIVLREGGEFEGDGMNIYGDGFYVTDDATTAKKYTKKNKKYQGSDYRPTVYQVIEKTPVKFYDLDKPIVSNVKDILDDLMNRRYSSVSELIEASIEDAGDGASLGQIMDEIRNNSRSFEVPAYEVQEGIFSPIRDALEKQGFGGFTHVGGNLAGKGKRTHQVRIYWDAPDRITLREIPADPSLAIARADEIRNEIDTLKQQASEGGCG